jgi:hypothetical protein
VALTTSLLVNKTAASGTGDRYRRDYAFWSYQATVVGTGAVAATVTVEVSNDGTYYETFATIPLSGTDSDSGSATGAVPWEYHRATWSGLSGTGATLNVVCHTDLG